MWRAIALVAFVSCGDLEDDRICFNRPCPTRQMKLCRAYLACYEATSGLLSEGGEFGTCWSTPESSDACGASCQASLEGYRAAGVQCDFSLLPPR